MEAIYLFGVILILGLIYYFGWVRKDSVGVSPPQSGPNNGPPNSAPPKMPNEGNQ
jgi:hypothetical protein